MDGIESKKTSLPVNDENNENQNNRTASTADQKQNNRGGKRSQKEPAQKEPAQGNKKKQDSLTDEAEINDETTI